MGACLAHRRLAHGRHALAVAVVAASRIAEGVTAANSQFRQRPEIRHVRLVDILKSWDVCEVLAVMFGPRRRQHGFLSNLIANWRGSCVSGRILSAMTSVLPSLSCLLEGKDRFDHPPILGLFPQNHVAAEGSMSVAPVAPAIRNSCRGLLFFPSHQELNQQHSQCGF
jgi:hypothetical protein